MLEAKADAVGVAIDDVLFLQPPQNFVHVLGGCAADRKQGRVEAAADHRRDLQQGAVGLRQPIRSGGKQAEQACRESACPQLSVENHFAGVDVQCALLEQEAENFLTEKGIALRTFCHLPKQGIRQAVHAEPRSGDMSDVLCVQRCEAMGGDARRAQPGGNILGSPSMDDEKIRERFSLEEACQKRL